MYEYIGFRDRGLRFGASLSIKWKMKFNTRLYAGLLGLGFKTLFGRSLQ